MALCVCVMIGQSINVCGFILFVGKLLVKTVYNMLIIHNLHIILMLCCICCYDDLMPVCITAWCTLPLVDKRIHHMKFAVNTK